MIVVGHGKKMGKREVEIPVPSRSSNGGIGEVVASRQHNQQSRGQERA
jgi:hypothetical protein